MMGSNFFARPCVCGPVYRLRIMRGRFGSCESEPRSVLASSIEFFSRSWWMHYVTSARVYQHVWGGGVYSTTHQKVSVSSCHPSHLRAASCVAPLRPCPSGTNLKPWVTNDKAHRFARGNCYCRYRIPTGLLRFRQVAGTVVAVRSWWGWLWIWMPRRGCSGWGGMSRLVACPGGAQPGY